MAETWIAQCIGCNGDGSRELDNPAPGLYGFVCDACGLPFPARIAGTRRYSLEDLAGMFDRLKFGTSSEMLHAHAPQE